jgi:SNF2 family DNA or RNA helicase
LLADEVGLGKTYTALAAMRDANTLLVVAPAALAPMWENALGALAHAG